MNRRDFLQRAAFGASAMAAAGSGAAQRVAGRPNVLWIIAEDASPHLGCYGEAAVKTPHLDALAGEGVRFDSAIISCPVCSPARSALATGMYQTTIGSHNHRSQNEGDKAGGNPDYYPSYALPEATPLVSDLFRAAGYYTCNGAGPEADKPGKTDYNFITSGAPYDGADWRDAPAGAPFFAQIQLSGGKWRGGKIEHNDFTLPPYYPDDPLMREDWAAYLASWERVDREVGAVVQSLKDAGVYENTLIVFITDHGISHARGKQFLYEDGLRIPMIVRFPDGRLAGTVRRDLALHIDLVPLSLAVAGIPAPGHLQGADLFAPDYAERPYLVSARDRCDETIDCIRSVRTARYKYIRNFHAHRPHLQRSQYKDGKAILQRLRELHALEALTPLQDAIFAPRRAPEELYDLEADPHETSNLAGDPGHAPVLAEQRERLYRWMVETRDGGLLPEPILEDLGREYGSKYAAMRQPGMAERIPGIIAAIEAGERNDRPALRAALSDADPAVRYYAATWMGSLRAVEHADALHALAEDAVPAVQVAGHLALCQAGEAAEHLPRLAALVDNPNRITGMYAMNAIEQTGILNDTVEAAARRAVENPYDGTQRYGRRLLAKCEALRGLG
ncbi:MAG: sulfatase-like hydrolase/transferase [Candidatus Hydrogenedentes bacterium]|nr:sulfatase-like hydrolase/transferase [Candidatus Hydrogenedentota bacterium]